VALVVVLAVYAALTPPEMQKAWEAPATDPMIAVAALLILAELAVVTAIAIFFSTFTSPVLAAAFTVGLVIAGQFGADLKNFEQVVESAPVAWAARALYYALPNLAPFDVKSQFVHAQPIAPSYVALTVGYGVFYVGALLTMAALLFSRRDFK
jgi:ABC-type transport system involved in multi-copper enzyme maturation permease subunit